MKNTLAGWFFLVVFVAAVIWAATEFNLWYALGAAIWCKAAK